MAGNERMTLLKKKYGERAINTAARMHPKDFEVEMNWRDEMDPLYARLNLEFSYGGLMNRGVLDERTRLLVLIAQCAAMAETDYLDSAIRAALNGPATPREILEVILQTSVYVGMPRINRAARLFHGIVTELGRLDELKRTQLPIEGNNAQRSLEAERNNWNVPPDKFPHCEAMLEKYGWHGISAGLRLQPTHHVEAVTRMDRTDQNFLKLWLDFIYGGMYVRDVLDDKTRLLCVVGVCTALDEMTQNENHVRNALLLGATPREVHEVAVQSTQYWGMPRSLRVMTLLDRVLRQQGRDAELTDAQLPLPLSAL